MKIFLKVSFLSFRRDCWRRGLRCVGHSCHHLCHCTLPSTPSLCPGIPRPGVWALAECWPPPALAVWGALPPQGSKATPAQRSPYLTVKRRGPGPLSEILTREIQDLQSPLMFPGQDSGPQPRSCSAAGGPGLTLLCRRLAVCPCLGGLVQPTSQEQGARSAASPVGLTGRLNSETQRQTEPRQQVHLSVG